MKLSHTELNVSNGTYSRFIPDDPRIKRTAIIYDAYPHYIRVMCIFVRLGAREQLN